MEGRLASADHAPRNPRREYTVAKKKTEIILCKWREAEEDLKRRRSWGFGGPGSKKHPVKKGSI